MPGSGGFKASQTEASRSSHPSELKQILLACKLSSCGRLQKWYQIPSTPHMCTLLLCYFECPSTPMLGSVRWLVLANRTLANMMQAKIWKVLGKWGLSSFAVLGILNVKKFGLSSQRMRTTCSYAERDTPAQHLRSPSEPIISQPVPGNPLAHCRPTSDPKLLQKNHPAEPSPECQTIKLEIKLF